MASFEDIVGRLKAAAEPTRLRLLRLLQTGEFNVKDLTQLLGQSQPRVSRHIRLLADADLIERHQEGSWVFVRASTDPAIRQFIAQALGMVKIDDPQIMRDTERAEQIRLNRAQLAQNYFDKNANHWDRIRSFHVPEQDVESALLDAVGPGLFDLVVDLGTGTGRILQLLADRADSLIGFDTNREMLKCARVRLDAGRLSNCGVRLGDIYDVQLANSSADVVIIHQVLHFLETPKTALNEAVRVLKPGGRLVVVDFAPHTLEFLREDHAHVRLGFGSTEIAGWLADAGMSHGAYRELRANAGEEQSLTVALWLASKIDAAESTAVKKRKVA